LLLLLRQTPLCTTLLLCMLIQLLLQLLRCC
jgi:hypothetical protein